MKRALLLACGRYADQAFAPLAFPLSDVDKVEGVLREAELCAFDEVEVIRDPTKAQAHRAIERLTAQSAQDDFILLYFSGHGKLSRSGSVVLVFQDTEGEYLHSSGVLDDELRCLFNQARARQKAIILDCCHSGAAGEEGFKRAAEDGLEALAQQVEGTFVLSASTKFEPAFERPELCGSALTTCLVEGLRSGAAAPPGAKVVTLSQLGEYVAREVPRRSPQRPKFWDHGGVGAVPFAKVARRLDRAWADGAIRELRKRFARDQIDEETFDEVRATLRGDLGQQNAQALALIDDLLERRTSPMAFARRWLARQRAAAAGAVPVEGPDDSRVSPEVRQVGAAPASDVHADDGPALPADPAAEAQAEPQTVAANPVIPADDAATAEVPTIEDSAGDIELGRQPIDETQFYTTQAVPDTPTGDAHAEADAGTEVQRTSHRRVFAIAFLINFAATLVAILVGLVYAYGTGEMLMVAALTSVFTAVIETGLIALVLRRYSQFSWGERMTHAGFMAIVMVIVLESVIHMINSYPSGGEATFAALLGLLGGVVFLAATRGRVHSDPID